MKLEGKVAIITGGARGIGQGIAESLLRKGVKVCICDVNSEQGEKTLVIWNKVFGPGRSMFETCDVTDHNQFEGVFKKVIREFGGVDIVVNNAGMSGEGPTKWRKTVLTNLVGVIEGTMLAVHYMDKTTGGRGGMIINIASTAGLEPFFVLPVYSGSKYGVVGYTRSMAADPKTSESGLSFATLCPAFTDTAMLNDKHSTKNQRKSYKFVAKLVQNLGMNSVDDVVSAFLQLVEADSNNGTVMVVSKVKGIEYIARPPTTSKL